MNTKTKDKRKLLLMLPVLVVPFLALGFYALDGGKGTGQGAGLPVSGINASLPDARLKKADPTDKMGFYAQAERDSAKVAENGLMAAAQKLGFRGRELEPQTSEIDEKLDLLNRELSKPAAPVPIPAYKKEPVNLKNDVDRLEGLMKTMQEPATDDPEMAQLSSMLEKIIDIQHPERAKEKYTPESVIPDSLFKAIPAIVEGNQKVTQGSVVKLKLLDTMRIGGQLIPKGQLLYGTAGLSNQRLIPVIRNIRLGTSIIPVDLSVFDQKDAMLGINAPEAVILDGVNSGANSAVQNMQFLSMDQSLGIQAAGAGINAAKSLFSRQVKRIKVKLKAGYPVLLRNNKQQKSYR